MACLISVFRALIRRLCAVAIGAMFLAPLPASAAIVFQDSFDAEGPGSILNYVGWSNWTVTAGAADIIQHGGFNIACAGGAGSCVDMDGTLAQAGELTSIAIIGAGSYTISFDISGNQRSGPTDGLTVAFGDLNETFFRDPSDPFQTITRSVTVGPGGDQIVFTHDGTDQLGIILDNVVVEDALAISSPGIGLILGFAALGILRRRR